MHVITPRIIWNLVRVSRYKQFQYQGFMKAFLIKPKPRYGLQIAIKRPSIRTWIQSCCQGHRCGSKLNWPDPYSIHEIKFGIFLLYYYFGRSMDAVDCLMILDPDIRVCSAETNSGSEHNTRINNPGCGPRRCSRHARVDPDASDPAPFLLNHDVTGIMLLLFL